MFSKKKEIDDKITYESDFVPLSTLVYAPIEAVANSNVELGKKIIDNIKSVGKPIQIAGETVTHLDHLSIGYEQLTNMDNKQILEEIVLQIPLLSIVPMNNLTIQKAKVEFNAEIRSLEEDEKIDFEARVCASKARSSDHVPKVHFTFDIESKEVPEGLLRVMDNLDLQQIPKKVESQPIDKDGHILTGKKKEDFLALQSRRNKYKHVDKLVQVLEQTMSHQKKRIDHLLKNQSLLHSSTYIELIEDKDDLINLKNADSEPLITIDSMYQNILKNNEKLKKIESIKDTITNELINYELEMIDDA